MARFEPKTVSFPAALFGIFEFVVRNEQKWVSLYLFQANKQISFIHGISGFPSTRRVDGERYTDDYRAAPAHGRDSSFGSGFTKHLEALPVLLWECQQKISMGSVGDCYDNAMMDSFYNPRQLHSAFKHLSISHWLPKKRGTLPRDNSVDQVEVRLGLA